MTDENSMAGDSILTDGDSKSNSASFNALDASGNHLLGGGGGGTINSSSGSPFSITIPQLVQKETKCLAWSKVFVLVVIIVAAILASIGTYAYTKQQEELEFITRYHDFAYEILAVSQINAGHIFNTYESMSLQMTAYAKGTNSDWPLVQFPHFEAQAQQAMTTTGARFIAFTPLVNNENRILYENYTIQNQEWIQDSIAYTPTSLSNITIFPSIFSFDTNDNLIPTPESNLYAPIAHTSPLDAQNARRLNFNAFSYPFFKRVFDGMVEADRAILSEILDQPDEENSTTSSTSEDDYMDPKDWPASFMAAPIYNKIGKPEDEDRIIAGVITVDMPWDSYFQNLIPEGIDGIYLIVRNTCGQEYTYVIHGPNVTYVGPGDIHDSIYDDYEILSEFTVFTSLEECRYSIHLFPSDELVEAYQSNQPLVNTLSVIAIFIITTCVFIMYDCLVEKRQEKVMNSANRTNAIVNSLFPENVRDRLLFEAENGGGSASGGTGAGGTTSRRNSNNGPGQDGDTPKGPLNVATSIITAIRTFNDTERRPSISNVYASQPIADLFPHATVLFGDISGFTAWSSVRDPAQVFILLETVYGTFDKIARRLGVFKVETIGDSYVAATGLPEAREDHAVVMARFARLCLYKLKDVVNTLDSRLGPGTAELTMRFGIHSGPVTAGVLRGEKSRFQLFGDTVNTASRMESTGSKDKIQVSQETAELLIAGGKARWITPRENKIVAKGKGELQTYWLAVRTHFANTLEDNTSKSGVNGDKNGTNGDSLLKITIAMENDDDDEEEKEIVQPHPSTITCQKTRYARLVEWNIDNLESLLKKVIAMRFHEGDEKNYTPETIDTIVTKSKDEMKRTTVLDELQEFITLPDQAMKYKQDPIRVQLSQATLSQLRDYVETIATMHNENPFHSFAHATHVGQSVSKLLSRVITVKDTTSASSSATSGITMGNNIHNNIGGKMYEEHLHRNTYGIASDPLTQFACAFSAMIHDVDHPGVPNAQLIEEKTEAAIQYNFKSVAEQNSVDVAWKILMLPQYKDLRASIYTNQSEFDRFRQLVVISVMATDIVDKELFKMRRTRWEKAFTNDDSSNSNNNTTDATPSNVDQREVSNRKATVVIEHLMQASDVAHTMQHWHVYAKWNEKLFHELYKAYMSGRAAIDPSANWYQGELGFFDYYIIPLAKKLKECGVFGVASDEYLNYAEANRREWELKGENVVRGYLETFSHLQQENKDSS